MTATAIHRTSGGVEYRLRGPLPRGTPDGLDGQERAYVMRSMTLSLRRCRPYSDMTDRAFDPYVRELERRWSDTVLIRLVACDPDDPGLFMGFIIGSERCLTYCNVKGGYRGLGLATDLGRHLGIVRGVPYAIEFPTDDITRPRPGRTLPIGLQHNSNWTAVVTPWSPTDE